MRSVYSPVRAVMDAAVPLVEAARRRGVSGTGRAITRASIGGRSGSRTGEGFLPRLRGGVRDSLTVVMQESSGHIACIDF